MHEIGGDFEVEPGALELDSIVDTCDGEADVTWYSSGRMALKAILRVLPHGVFLVPSYLCDAVLQPFRELNVPFRFYTIETDLRFDVAGLRRMCGSDVVGVLHIDLFGVQPDAEREAFLAGLVDDGLCVITDITHSYPGLADFRDRAGTHIVCSVRKTLPLPDGAFVVTRGAHPQQPTLPAGGYVGDKLQAQVEKYRYLYGEAPRAFLPALRSAEAGFEQDVEIRSPSAVSRQLFRTIDLHAAGVARRRNFSQLLSESAGGFNAVAPLLNYLPEAGSP
ncbi:MAG: hypothetical protein ACM3VX_09430, partial [Bacteroidota bacterium]